MKKTLLSIALLFLSISPWSWAKDGASLALAFEREVDIRLDVPDQVQAQAYSAKLWVMRPDRVTTLWPGRYLVIIDSGSATRPAWSPQPATRRGKANTKRDTVF